MRALKLPKKSGMEVKKSKLRLGKKGSVTIAHIRPIDKSEVHAITCITCNCNLHSREDQQFPRPTCAQVYHSGDRECLQVCRECWPKLRKAIDDAFEQNYIAWSRVGRKHWQKVMDNDFKEDSSRKQAMVRKQLAKHRDCAECHLCIDCGDCMCKVFV